MTRFKPPFRNWTWDQVLLILGPVAVSIILVALYAAGHLPIDWPALLIMVLLVNLAGDVAFALKSERSVKHRRVTLCNEMIGRRGVTDGAFLEYGRCYEGIVMLAGERWRARSDRAVAARAPVYVVGRRGLVVEVASEHPHAGT